VGRFGVTNPKLFSEITKEAGGKLAHLPAQKNFYHLFTFQPKCSKKSKTSTIAGYAILKFLN